jgi:hypothetical protein
MPAVGLTTGADTESTVETAIAGYDSLTAVQIVEQLPRLSRADLDRIGRYEAAHRGRRTILGQVDRLRASS